MFRKSALSVCLWAPECVFGSERKSKSQAGRTRTKILPPPQRIPAPATCTLTLTHSHFHTHTLAPLPALSPPSAPPGHARSSILSATSALSPVPGPLPASLRFILKKVQHLTHFPRAGLGGNNCCYIGRAPAALGRCPGFHRAGAPLTPCMGAQPTPTQNPLLRTKIESSRRERGPSWPASMLRGQSLQTLLIGCGAQAQGFLASVEK